MCGKLISLVSFLLVLTLASISYSEVVIGDFENDMDGWALWNAAPAGTTTSFSTTGASLNGYSLKVDVPRGGFQTVVYIPLQTEGLVTEFFNSDLFSVDVTRLAAEWTGPGAYAWVELVVNARSNSGDVFQSLGERIRWSPGDGDKTQIAIWDYSAAKELIDEDSISYLELIIVTNYDENFTAPGSYYLDNAKLRTFAGVIGDWENEMDGWEIWPGPEPAPEGTTTDYNDTTGVTLNSNSLKLYVPEGEVQRVLYIQLDDEGLVDDFFHNNIFSMDVTRLAEEWTPGDPNATSGIELIVNASSDSGDVFQNLGGRLWWSPGDGNDPRTAIWDYSAAKALIDEDSISWLEFIIVTNFDDVNYTDGTYYLDNAQLSPRRGFIVIGNWENTDDGWIEWTDPQPTIGPPKYTYVSTGATFSNMALKVIPDEAYDLCLSIKLQSISYNLLGEGLANNKLSIDVTWVRDEWIGSGGACSVQLVINEEGVGWQGLGLPDIDTNNPGNPGQWDPDEYPPGTVYTTTMVWDYSSYIDDMTSTADPPAGWLEFILTTTYDATYDEEGNSSGSFYFDNARLIDGPKASNPTPANGATDEENKLTLSWREGRYADTHDVYFGTDETKVTDANRTNHPDVDFNNVSVNSYNPGTLEFETTYYWRIDEVNMTDEPTTWKGDVWSFTTGHFFIVDNMESYGDAPTPGPPPSLGSRIWYTWKDGEGWKEPSPVEGNGSGSVVDRDDEITHGGGQSLAIYYDNDGTNYFGHGGKDYYSEVTANTAHLPIGDPNWTKGGVKALVLWFYGNPDNDANDTERIYVKLNGVHRIDYDGDMNDIKQASWHEWSIDLTTLGIDLTNVTEIAIGFGDENNTTTPGGAGIVYFDDIRLYPPRCILSKRSVDFAKVDYAPVGNPSGDCVIDYREIEMMSQDWLVIDGDFISTANPGTDGLVAYYPLDEGAGTTTADASGNNHDGTFSGGVSWISPGVMDGNAINVDGGDTDPESRILIGNWNPAEPSGQLTLAIWAKWAGLKATNRPQGLVGKRNGWGGSTVMFMFEVNTDGNTGGFALRQFSDAVSSPENIMIPFIGQWTHLAATFDGTTATLYLNGGEVASGSYSFGGGTTVDMAIGNTTSNQYWSEAFNGDLDEVYIFNRALSPAEIAYLADTTPEDGEVYTPVPSVAELYSAEPKGSRSINFRDFAILANHWLEEQLWP